MENHKI